MLTLYKRNVNVDNVTQAEPSIAKLTSNVNLPGVLKDKHFFLCKDDVALPKGFFGYIVVDGNKELGAGLNNVLYLGDEFSYLDSGDVIRYNPTKPSITVLYRRTSPNNYFLITERCNSYCLMCSQPPRDIQDDYHVDDILQTIPLIDRRTCEIGLTGGEPTLIGERLVHMIKQFRNHLPYTALHVLTNGRLFSNHSYTQKFEGIEHPDCMFGVPLYSDSPEIHNYIVQAENAFDETIKGILNLKRFGQRVEIRVVVHRENYSRLRHLADFIGRNLTFIDQVVFMGLEPTGFAKANMKALWIDPYNYQVELREAVEALDRYHIKTKIYNVQLCLLDETIAHKSVRSISDWKVEYDDECTSCVRSGECCGIFGTGTGKHSEHIVAFLK